MTITKEVLANSLHKQFDIPKSKSATIDESILEITKRALESGEDVLISGFGKFCVKDKNERRGRNPATSNEMTLGARRVVTYKCSPALRKRINGKK